MDQRHIIGIDHGNYAIKSKNTVFPAHLKKYSANPGAVGDILSFGKDYYSLIPEPKISPVMDKLENDDYFIMTLFALRDELEARGLGRRADIILGVGVPPQMFSADMVDRVQKYFRKNRSVKFAFGEDAYDVKIADVFVFTQGSGAIVYTKNPIVAAGQKGRFLAVDIGGGTTDFILYENGRINLNVHRSIPKGMLHFIDNAKTRLWQPVAGSFQMEPDVDEIMDILAGGEQAGKDPDASRKKRILDQAVDEFAEEILERIEMTGVNTKRIPILLCGGGSAVFEDAFRRSDRTGTVEREPDIRANALGFEKLTAGLVKNRLEPVKAADGGAQV